MMTVLSFTEVPSDFNIYHRLDNNHEWNICNPCRQMWWRKQYSDKKVINILEQLINRHIVKWQLLISGKIKKI